MRPKYKPYRDHHRRRLNIKGQFTEGRTIQSTNSVVPRSPHKNLTTEQKPSLREEREKRQRLWYRDHHTKIQPFPRTSLASGKLKISQMELDRFLHKCSHAEAIMPRRCFQLFIQTHRQSVSARLC